MAVACLRIATAPLGRPGAGWDLWRSSVCRAVASLGLMRCVRLARNVEVGHSTTAFNIVALERFVSGVFRVRVFQYNVPGVQQAGKIAQDT